jgi:MoaA/NifB/PqqE/SkfB family radical SAM enzyme
VHHRSRGERCFAGERAISVDGEGTIRRCHFIPEKLGNLYEDPLETVLKPRACTAETCGCHIGYVHLERLGLYETFEGGVLERIPAIRAGR